MELVEIVLQGLKGFPASARVSLGAGFTASMSTSASRTNTVVDVIVDLLAPGSVGTISPDPQSPTSRAGLHVVGRDAASYRILKDVRAGQTSLLRQQGEGMQPVTQDAAEFRSALSAQLGFPAPEILRRIFILRRQDLPSVAGIKTASEMEATSPDQRSPAFSSQPLPPGFSEEEAAPAYGHLSDDDKRARLKEIEGQIDQGGRIRELEFQLDGLQKRAFEIEEKAAPIAKLRSEVSDGESVLKRFSDVIDVPSDFRASIDRALAVRKAHAQDLAELDRKKAALEDAHAISLQKKSSLASKIRDGFSNNLVRAGVAIAFVAIAIASLGASLGFPRLQWIAFVDVPAFFVALIGGMQVISDVERKDHARLELGRVQRDRESLQNKSDLDESAFGALLARYKLSLNDLSELDTLIERLEHKRSLKVKLDGAQSRLDAALADPDAQDLEINLKSHREKAKAIEEQLYEAGGYIVDPSTLQAEVDALKRALSTGPTTTTTGGAADSSSTGSGTARTVDDMIGGIVNACADLMTTAPATLAEKLAPRLSQYIGGMSGQRFTAARFRGTSNLVLTDSSGDDVEFTDLKPGAQDLVYVALQLTAAEIYVRKMRMPLIIDRALDVFAPEADAFHLSLLQFLANHTQVWVLTEREALTAGATHRVTL